MKPRILLILGVLALAALACTYVSQLVGDQEQAPAPATDVLFQDDFSDTSSGWDRVHDPNGVTDYEDGVYRIWVNTTNTDVWANPGLDFTDVRIEVDATKVDGDDNNDYGLVCRYQDGDNYYFFVISSDGYYGIGKVVKGELKLLGSEAMLPNESIHKGNAANHLRADCSGSMLRMYVNGEMIAEQQDGEFASGDVGLLAGSFDAPGTDIHFDNFVVLKP
jgi:hypothetical protein